MFCFNAAYFLSLFSSRDLPDSSLACCLCLMLSGALYFFPLRCAPMLPRRALHTPCGRRHGRRELGLQHWLLAAVAAAVAGDIAAVLPRTCRGCSNSSTSKTSTRHLMRARSGRACLVRKSCSVQAQTRPPCRSQPLPRARAGLFHRPARGLLSSSEC